MFLNIFVWHFLLLYHNDAAVSQSWVLLVGSSVGRLVLLVIVASQGLAVRNSLQAVIRLTVWAQPGISTSWFWWCCIMTAGNHPQPGIISSNSISHIVAWLRHPSSQKPSIVTEGNFIMEWWYCKLFGPNNITYKEFKIQASVKWIGSFTRSCP